MIKGVVQKILVNPQYGLTSFTIKGQDGFFSLGKDKPTFNEGDAIQFETNQVGKYTYAKDIAPWADGGTTSGATVSGVVAAASSGTNAQGNSWKGRGGSQRGGFGGKSEEEKQYWANRDAKEAVTQRRIEIQAARNAAIETVKVMWEKEIIPIPKNKKDHYDAFLASIEELTDTYLRSTSGRLDPILSVSQASREASSGNLDQGGRAVEAVPASTGTDGGNWD